MTEEPSLTPRHRFPSPSHFPQVINWTVSVEPKSRWYNSDRLWSPVAQDGISQWRYSQSWLSSCKYMYLSRNLTSAVVSVNQVSCQTSATNELLFPPVEKYTNKSTSASQFEFRRTWTRVIRAQIANHSREWKRGKKEKQKRIFLSCAPDRLQRNSASPPRSPRTHLRLPKFHKKKATFLEAIRSLLAWYAKVHQRQVFNVICALDILRFQASDGFAVFIQTFYPGNSHSNLTCINVGISEWRFKSNSAAAKL